MSVPRFLGMFILFVSIASLIGMFNLGNEYFRFYTAGLFGAFISNFVTAYFSRLGGFIVFITFIILSLALVTEILISSLHRASDGRRALVVAGRAAASGQKVHNLLAATADLAAEIRALVFVDSDARPRRQWLRLAMARLAEPGVAAATGYRWFVPSGLPWPIASSTASTRRSCRSSAATINTWSGAAPGQSAATFSIRSACTGRGRAR